MVVPLAFGWRHLLFANWPVDSDRLDAHLPGPLSVDEYDGTGWLSVVPLTNVRVRPRGLPEWMGVRLLELNLRTYVTCDVPRDEELSTRPNRIRRSGDGEPGVYFFNLDAQGLLSVLGARALHYLPYYYARIDLRREDGRVAFSSRRLHPGARPATFSTSYWPTGEPFEADPGSLAEFLTERRRLYTQSPSGALRYTDVSHDRWTLYPAAASTTKNTLFEANGFDHPDAEPVLYYSPGVDVVTTRNKRWDR